MKNSNYTTIECSRCATCCIEPIVPVTNTDVRRICAFNGKTPSSIIRFYSPSEMEFDSESAVWVRFSYGKRALGLRKKNERCMFLNDQNLCSVYEARPMTCRTFPYQVDFDDDDQVSDVDLNLIVNCKSKIAPSSPLTEVIKNVRIEEEEDELYFDLIRKWNRKKIIGTSREFLKFIKLESK